MSKLIPFIGLLLITLFSCSEEIITPKIVSSQPIKRTLIYQPTPKINFTEVSREKGINFIHQSGATGDKLQPEAMGGGVAFFDFDNDGDPDLVAVSGTDWKSAFTDRGATSIALYRNDEGEGFTNVTQAMGLSFNGYGMGIAIGDYDGDGWKDIYVTALGKNVLYHNEKGLAFKDSSQILKGVCSEYSYTTGAAFFDSDNDGDLDLFAANYINWSKEIDDQTSDTIDGDTKIYSGPFSFEGAQPCFYQNLGNNKFVEIAKRIGLYIKSDDKPIGKSLGILPIDINNDLKLDLLIANDTVRNFAFINTGNGHFDEQAEKIGFAYNNDGKATAGMGIDVAWLSEKQTLTVAMGNFLSEMSSVYQLDQKHFIFSDNAAITGIGAESRVPVTFGVLFVDLDLDGRPDYVQANGQIDPDIATILPSQSYQQSAQIFWNCGKSCTHPFVLLPKKSIGDIHQPLVGRGMSAADFDGDGDIDLVISEVNGRLRLFQNNQNTDNHWIKLDLRQKNKNRFAIGALVEIKIKNQWQKQLVMPSRSYLAQNPTTLIFGLGKSNHIDQIKITWPDGKTQLLNNILANQKLKIVKQ